MRSSHAAGLVLLVLAIAGGGKLAAHDPFPSKYMFNEDVSPLLVKHCGGCHVTGGAAPMPLAGYAAVKPWALAIVEQLQQGRMPPAFVDPSGPAVRGMTRIPARDLDMMLSWAAGGAPEGSAAHAPDTPMLPAAWPLGPPDAMLTMETPHVVVAARQDEVREFTLRTSWPGTRWVAAIDLLPGARSMVRDAQLLDADGTVMGMWIAGERPVRAPAGAAFRVPAGAALTLRVHYRKAWDDSRADKADQSTVGVYFSAPARAIHTVAPPMLSRAVRVLAARPHVTEPMSQVDIVAVQPGGRRRTLLRLRDADAGWPRRYWLVTPVALPSGTRIESSVPVALDVVAP